MIQIQAHTVHQFRSYYRVITLDSICPFEYRKTPPFGSLPKFPPRVITSATPDVVQELELDQEAWTVIDKCGDIPVPKTIWFSSHCQSSYKSYAIDSLIGRYQMNADVRWVLVVGSAQTILASWSSVELWYQEAHTSQSHFGGMLDPQRM
jgi:hypothetical protein